MPGGARGGSGLRASAGADIGGRPDSRRGVATISGEAPRTALNGRGGEPPMPAAPPRRNLDLQLAELESVAGIVPTPPDSGSATPRKRG